MLIIPGGNTYITMQGLAKHAETIKFSVSHGLPYVGESTGTIVAGKDSSSAALKSADTCPADYNSSACGLELLSANLVVHACGRSDNLAIPGAFSRHTGEVLKNKKPPQRISVNI